MKQQSHSCRIFSIQDEFVKIPDFQYHFYLFTVIIYYYYFFNMTHLS